MRIMWNYRGIIRRVHSTALAEAPESHVTSIEQQGCCEGASFRSPSQGSHDWYVSSSSVNRIHTEKYKGWMANKISVNASVLV